MARFVLRVWLPDKPGALGLVARAIGSVGASLTGIDILEQEGGWAIDELVVDAVDAPNAADKLIAALTLIEGVSVEDIRARPEVELIDSKVDALETAAELVAQSDAASLMDVFVHRALHDMYASWAALVELASGTALVTTGDSPTAAWIAAFVAGSSSSEALAGGRSGPDDIAWTELLESKCALVVGRDGRPFRARERSQLSALSRIADKLLSDMRR